VEGEAARKHPHILHNLGSEVVNKGPAAAAWCGDVEEFYPGSKEKTKIHKNGRERSVKSENHKRKTRLFYGERVWLSAWEEWGQAEKKIKCGIIANKAMDASLEGGGAGSTIWVGGESGEKGKGVKNRLRTALQ